MKKSKPASSNRRQAIKLAAVAGLSPLLLEGHAHAASLTPDTDQIMLPSDVLLYNITDGSLATGTVDANGTFTSYNSYPAGAFSPGWTHLIMLGNGVIFLYNTTNGAGATVRLNGVGGIITYNAYPAETFALNWTNITAVGDSGLLFYSVTTGSAMTATVGSTGAFASMVESATNSFMPGWTSIVTSFSG